jgi:transcriptional regulator with XRE-family HTH domain
MAKRKLKKRFHLSQTALRTIEKNYSVNLNQFTDQVFQAMEQRKWTQTDFALRAGLAVSTVSNLNHCVTKLPRFMTVFKLARAVGMELSLRNVKADAVPVLKLKA